jgi:hypothetical protein
MMRVASPELEPQVVQRLAALQRAIDAERVAAGKVAWDRKPVATFDLVRAALSRTCSGNRRCHYCEDSLADEIEHMRPKDLYPEAVFRSDNYLFSCGPCNSPKNNQFAVTHKAGNSLQLVDVTRRRGAEVTPPMAGIAALLDPHIDDPVNCIWLDFDTGIYVSNVDDDGSALALRVEYTIKLLRLNLRDELVRGRRAAYSSYLARLKSFVAEQPGMSPERQAGHLADFRAERYRGVWERMKHYRENFQVLRDLFQACPAALEL